MLQLFLSLLFVQHTLATVSSNLRGNAASVEPDSHHRVTGNELLVNQHNNLKVHEKSMHDLIMKIADNAKQNGVQVTKSLLEISDVSYQNFLVTRTRANGDCNGPVAGLIARNMGCVQVPGGSMQLVCTSTTSADSYIFTTDDCTGPTYSNPEYFNTCYNGVGYQCLSKSDLPEFAEKQGLFTYKFHSSYACDNYAYNVLNYSPNWTNDRVDFDDTALVSDGTGFDDADACCLQSEINPGALFDACPYPLCDGDSGDSRRLSSKKSADDATATPVSVRSRPERWWESKAKTQYVIQSMKVQAYNSTEWFREYSVTQQRTGVCVYDEKFQLWVKTSCHGKRDSLVYEVFADAQCTLLVKKAEHTLSEAFPAYGMCAQSTSLGDTRYSLTVCHNKDGVNFPNLILPPIE